QVPLQRPRSYERVLQDAPLTRRERGPRPQELQAQQHGGEVGQYPVGVRLVPLHGDTNRALLTYRAMHAAGQREGDVAKHPRPLERRRRVALVDDDTTFLALLEALFAEYEGYEAFPIKEWADA